MYNSLLIILATATKGGSSFLDKVIFAFDYIILPLAGVGLLFIVYKLIKNKKIIVDKQEDTNN